MGHNSVEKKDFHDSPFHYFDPLHINHVGVNRFGVFIVEHREEIIKTVHGEFSILIEVKINKSHPQLL